MQKLIQEEEAAIARGDLVAGRVGVQFEVFDGSPGHFLAGIADNIDEGLAAQDLGMKCEKVVSQWIYNMKDLPVGCFLNEVQEAWLPLARRICLVEMLIAVSRATWSVIHQTVS